MNAVALANMGCRTYPNRKQNEQDSKLDDEPEGGPFALTLRHSPWDAGTEKLEPASSTAGNKQGRALAVACADPLSRSLSPAHQRNALPSDGDTCTLLCKRKQEGGAFNCRDSDDPGPGLGRDTLRAHTG